MTVVLDLLKGRLHDEAADTIVTAVEQGSGLGLDADLRHLAGQAARQRCLPRDPARDDRFLFHLELALRDLATRPVEPKQTRFPQR